MKKRIIKFRAWDAKRKVMILSVGFTDSDCGRYWQREEFMVDDRSDFVSQDWIPMQFTGLLDKTGKEIYEADIIQFEGTTEYGYGEIIFDNGMYWIQEKDSLLRVDMVCIETCKVIGNIFENSELLS